MMLQLRRALPLVLTALLASSALLPGVTVETPSLSLSFETPEKWRITTASTSDELQLHPSKSKTTPLLRVRSFYGNFSAEDRLPEMVRGLPAEEAGIVFTEMESWELGGKRFETAHAVYAEGIGEWHAAFTLVDQPNKLQHGFWLFGRKKDLERHWPAVQASIATAKAIAGADGPKRGDEREARKKPKVENTEAIWSDAKLGVQLTAWPAGFVAERKSLKLAAKKGMRLDPEDERAHATTHFLLRGSLENGEAAGDETAAALHVELQSDSSVRELRRVPLRIGGEKGSLLKWVSDESAGAFSHETYIVQRGALVLRIDYRAEEGWARARSRRTLVKDFIASVGFL